MTTTTSNRANKVTVTVTNEQLIATFWRTHKKVAVVTADEIGFTENSELNSTANRELFRVFAIENTPTVEFDPSDNRMDSNKFPTHWADESTVAEWADRMIRRDADEWTSKMGVELRQIKFIGLTEISGKPLKYEHKDSFAWATVECEMVVGKDDDETGILTTLAIKSGQMCKPSEVLGLKWNFTNFKQAVTEEMGITENPDGSLESMTKAELKEMVKTDGLEITGISKMTKEQLVVAIESARNSDQE